MTIKMPNGQVVQASGTSVRLYGVGKRDVE
jgi:hypothetical protein